MTTPDQLHPPGIEPWEVIGDDEVVYEGFARVVRRPLRMPNGRELKWDMLDLPDTVTVLALTGTEQVVLVRQYRPGHGGLVTSMPGGFVDSEESVMTAAARELVEETGYQAAELISIGHAQAVSATNRQHVVIAQGCELSGVQRFDEFEECEVLVAQLSDFRRWLRTEPLGAREHAYLALDHLGLL